MVNEYYEREIFRRKKIDPAKISAKRAEVYLLIEGIKAAKAESEKK
jgi:hypothetical protein